MTKDEARREILRAFRAWAQETGATIPYRATDGGFIFYGWLERNRPDLLSFSSPADRWTLVKGWLNRAGLTQS